MGIDTTIRPCGYKVSLLNFYFFIFIHIFFFCRCKTPVSSLSSRITEDVRTKGNKSVFVRVGEGLYTLRKGLKKQELEKYLTTKYPKNSLNDEQPDYDLADIEFNGKMFQNMLIADFDFFFRK